MSSTGVPYMLDGVVAAYTERPITCMPQGMADMPTVLGGC